MHAFMHSLFLSTSSRINLKFAPLGAEITYITLILLLLNIKENLSVSGAIELSVIKGNHSSLHSYMKIYRVFHNQGKSFIK